MQPYKGKPKPGMLAVGHECGTSGPTSQYVVGIIDGVVDHGGDDWSITAVYIPKVGDRFAPERKADHMLRPEAINVGCQWRSLAIVFHLTDERGHARRYAKS
jgi:hypothetical protein